MYSYDIDKKACENVEYFLENVWHTADEHPEGNYGFVFIRRMRGGQVRWFDGKEYSLNKNFLKTVVGWAYKDALLP